MSKRVGEIEGEMEGGSGGWRVREMYTKFGIRESWKEGSKD